MKPHTLSESADRALAQARDEARRLGHDSIGAEHILLVLIQPGGVGEPVLRRLGLEPAEVREELRRRLTGLVGAG